jgi:biotin carboxylase
MTDPHVLLIGWRPDAVAALQRLGTEVTCVVAVHELDQRGDLLDDAHTVVARDPHAAEPTLAALERQGVDPGRFDVVTSQFEFSLVNAAVVGGARSPMSLRQALLLRDKDLQKRRIRAARIPVADSVPVLRPRDLHGFAHHQGVLKPLDLSASRGVRAWTTDTERAEIAETLAASYTAGPWLAESWVEGEELHIDGVVRHGEVRFASVGRYLLNPLAIRERGLRGSLMEHPERQPELYIRAREFATRVTAALSHRDGVFHLEVYERSDGSWIFGECGGRIAGGSIDTMIRLQHGVDLHEEWARAVLGLPSGLAEATSPSSFGHVFLAAGPGRLLARPPDSAIAARAGVWHVAPQPPPPAQAPASPDARVFPVTAVVEGKDERHAAERVRDLADWFATKCGPGYRQRTPDPHDKESP